jgi:hypothetical protein
MKTNSRIGNLPLVLSSASFPACHLQFPIGYWLSAIFQDGAFTIPIDH